MSILLAAAIEEFGTAEGDVVADTLAFSYLGLAGGFFVTSFFAHACWEYVIVWHGVAQLLAFCETLHQGVCRHTFRLLRILYRHVGVGVSVPTPSGNELYCNT